MRDVRTTPEYDSAPCNDTWHFEGLSLDPAIYPPSRFDSDHRAGMEDAE